MRTINDIVLMALNLASVFPVNEMVPAEQINAGIRLFNLLTDSMNSQGSMIPFWTNLTFPTVAGQEFYNVSMLPSANVLAMPIIEIETAISIQNFVTYPLSWISFGYFNRTGRLQNLSTRPYNIILTKAAQSSTLQLYPIPDQVYQINIIYKGFIPNLVSGQELSAIPNQYHLWLSLWLSMYLKMIFPQANFTEDHKAALKDLTNQLKMTVDIDVPLNVSSALQNIRGLVDISSIYRGTP